MPRRNGAEREASNKPLFYAPAILLSNRRFRGSNDFEDREKSRFLFRFRWTVDEYETILSRSSNVFFFPFFPYRQFVTPTVEDSIKKIHVTILPFKETHVLVKRPTIRLFLRTRLTSKGILDRTTPRTIRDELAR